MRKVVLIGSTVPKELLKTLPDASVAGNKMQLGLLHGFLKNGCDVMGISAEPHEMWKDNKKPIVIREKSLCDGGVNIQTIRYCNLPIIKQLSIMVNLIFEILCELHSTDDIIIVYNTMSIFAFPSLVAAKIRGCKKGAVIADLPIQTSKNIIQYFEDYLQEKRINKFDFLISLTENIHKDFAPEVPYCVIEAGCDPQDFSDIRLCNSNLTVKHIVFSGTINILSGIDLIVEAMKYVRTGVVLDIYGKGKLTKRVENQIKNSSNIIYHGVVPNEEMIRIQSDADLLVCPRRPDTYTTKYTFPSKILEYICAGKPVLSNRLEGIPIEYEEYINFADDDSPSKWAKMINIITEDENQDVYKKKAELAREKCMRCKSWEYQCKHILKLINCITENET